MTATFFDFETLRFGPKNLAPRPVCVSIATEKSADVIASCDPYFDDVLEAVWLSDMIVAANTAYDASVMLAHRPKLSSLVWKAYREDRVTDIQIRAKLIVLADTGNLKFAPAPNGAMLKLKYSQLELEKRLLGIDRSSDKDDDDSWRTHFSALEGMPASEYPKDAFDYSLADAVNGKAIYDLQEVQLSVLGAQFLNTRAALALQLSSCWGFPVDVEEVERVFAELSERYHEKNYPELIQLGILRPGQPPRPHKRQLAKAIELAGQEPEDWSSFREKLSEQGINFTAGKESSKNEELLRAYVEQISKQHDIEVRRTDSGQVSYAEEVQVELKGLDPVFDSFLDRTAIQKLVTTELPRMRGGRVHPGYDILKATSRTSSFGNSKSDKNPPYPSVGIQQIDERVRNSYIADPGWALCSIDYDAIELVSAGQRCLDLFGHSALADAINAGKDPHAMLGARLLARFDGFQGSYEDFMVLAKTDPDKFEHWRLLSKPTGLGLWGGLGAETFISYAKKTYGVDLIKLAGSKDAAIEMAKAMKHEWQEMLPETRAYFNWVNTECVDLDWSLRDQQKYCYVSPFGTIRRNCSYCPATNGAALQTPTAEGAKIALFDLAEAFHDTTVNSCLLGCHKNAFIHDEVIWSLPIDDYMHDRVMEARHLMQEGMAKVMTKVRVGTSASLMLRWRKDAKPVFDKDNRLTIWKPQ